MVVIIILKMKYYSLLSDKYYQYKVIITVVTTN